MNFTAILHRAKSEYAYAYDKNTLHIMLRTAKNDVSEVELIYGDPFNWDNIGDEVFWVKHNVIMKKRYQTKLFDYYFAAIKPQDLRSKYAFIITDLNNNKHLYGSKKFVELNNSVPTSFKNDEQFDLSNYFNFPYINPEDLAQTPSWVKDTTWYQIFPDRFNNLNNISSETWGSLPVNNKQIFGGNINGVIDKIPYLKDLGINGIYFTPLFEAETAHKYDTVNYFKIDPTFGTNEDFKNLVKKAHENDIKIMLDGVFNHSGFGHPFFLDLAKNNEDSIYKDAFYVDKFPVINFPLKNNRPHNFDQKNLNFKTFAYTPFMPKWNTDNKLASKHLLDVVEYWIKDYGIDAWRIDVSNEISHDFLRSIKKVSRTANKDTFILGENWDQSIPWLQGDQVDSVMNYDLSVPLWEYLEHKITLDEFVDLINTYLALTPKNVIENMFNLIDSHDTIRILKRLDDNIDRAKIAYLFMFLSSGAPNIYYGGEIGLTGQHDPDNRRCMLWDEKDQDKEFYKFIQTLISLRNKYPSFKTTDYHFISNDLLAFTKNFDNEELLVIINNSDQSKTYTFKDAYKDNYLNLFNNKVQNYDKIVLEPYKFIVLKKED